MWHSLNGRNSSNHFTTWHLRDRSPESIAVDTFPPRLYRCTQNCPRQYREHLEATLQQNIHSLLKTDAS